MTINLEKELIKANRKLMTPQELLVVREYEKNPEFYNDDTLARIGLAANLAHGKGIKEKVSAFKKQTEKFKQERVFHISQIEEVCNKYCLRFLPSSMYKGTIDKELPFKISNFEAAYEVKCQCDEDQNSFRFSFPTFEQVVNHETGLTELRVSYPEGYKDPVQNTFIAAPASSFKLQERPKDPLFFYKINEEYYYLIHKWGNDLNVFRRFMGVMASPYQWFGIMFSIPLIALMLSLVSGSTVAIYINAACLLVNTGIFIRYVINNEVENYPWIKHDWRSKYIE